MEAICSFSVFKNSCPISKPFQAPPQHVYKCNCISNASITVWCWYSAPFKSPLGSLNRIYRLQKVGRVSERLIIRLWELLLEFLPHPSPSSHVCCPSNFACLEVPFLRGVWWVGSNSSVIIGPFFVLPPLATLSNSEDSFSRVGVLVNCAWMAWRTCRYR